MATFPGLCSFLAPAPATRLLMPLANLQLFLKHHACLQMKRSNVLVRLIPALLAALTVVAPGLAAERPNVLLILVDDLKPALGCYGDPIAKTPNIDALADRGMRFDLAYCNQAVCAPSRFTLMLGSHSTSTGLYGLGSQLREIVPDAVTMPQHFAKHGYRTESLGKVFHIGHGNHGDPDSFSVPHFHDKVIEYLDSASTDGGKLTREEAYFTNQKLGEIRSLPRGAAYESPDVDDGQYADGRVAAETVKRLQAAKARREQDGAPFFIAAGFARPHLPFSAPQKYWDQYDPATLPMPQFEFLPTDAPGVAGKRGGEITNYKPVPEDRDAEYSSELKRSLIHGYYASMSFVDAQIGRVVGELDRLGLAENTIVVLWGDHGFHLGDLGIWTKHTNYEQANRIPILISAPGVTQPGSSTKQLAESVDIFPTLAELAGLPAPSGPQPIDGLSLVPVLKDGTKRVRDHAFHAYPKGKLGRAIRTERYRLVEWRNAGDADDTAEYELYDYETDPLETRNLAAAPSGVVSELKAKLAAYSEPIDPRRPARRDPESPQIANREITLQATVRGHKLQGVVMAQGGRQFGYSLHFADGKPTLDVRIDEQVTRLQAAESVTGRVELEARITAKQLSLTVNGKTVTRPSPGLIPRQPLDQLSIGKDDLSAAGDYESPNPFSGTLLAHQVLTTPAKAPSR
jgi:iduronate 2-sulfatase